VRIGIGFDSHNLVPGRRLVLGGVQIPFELGLEGHSDADVLTHAVIDALLGAAGLGSIGEHFPDTDERYRNIASTELLGDTMLRIGDAKLRPVNVDTVIIAQRPKLAPYIGAMRSSLASVIGIPDARVAVKATTTEGKDATGRGEAIAAHAAVLLVEYG
jgi:2-C-methyl-D-erythritol 2,4-cyclodiphosphate synthase